MFELGRKVEPYDSEWLVELARVYAQTERQGQADRRAEGPGADRRRRPRARGSRLARLLLDDGQVRPRRRSTPARRWRSTSATDEAGEVLFKALEEQKKDAEAERMRKVLEGA